MGICATKPEVSRADHSKMGQRMQTLEAQVEQPTAALEEAKSERKPEPSRRPMWRRI